MKLFLVSVGIDAINDYATYDSVIVSAESEDDARTIHPDGAGAFDSWRSTTWVLRDQLEVLEVEYLGETEKERGVILASYNGG